VEFIVENCGDESIKNILISVYRMKTLLGKRKFEIIDPAQKEVDRIEFQAQEGGGELAAEFRVKYEKIQGEIVSLRGNTKLIVLNSEKKVPSQIAIGGGDIKIEGFAVKDPVVKYTIGKGFKELIKELKNNYDTDPFNIAKIEEFTKDYSNFGDWKPIKLRLRKTPSSFVAIKADKALLSVHWPGETKVFELFCKENVILGRTKEEGADIPCCFHPISSNKQKSYMISMKHAILAREKAGFSIKDMSQNGTFLNNQMCGDEARILKDRDRIVLWKELEFIFTEFSGGARFVREDKYGREEDGTLREYILFKEKVSIGTNERNGIVLKEGNCAPTHAQILWEEGCFKIEDLGSQQGTTIVNGLALRRGFPHLLKGGEKIKLGNVECEFILGVGK